jgi:hypothetical protein
MWQAPGTVVGGAGVIRTPENAAPTDPGQIEAPNENRRSVAITAGWKAPFVAVLLRSDMAPRNDEDGIDTKHAKQGTSPTWRCAHVHIHPIYSNRHYIIM